MSIAAALGAVDVQSKLLALPALVPTPLVVADARRVGLYFAYLGTQEDFVATTGRLTIPALPPTVKFARCKMEYLYPVDSVMTCQAWNGFSVAGGSVIVTELILNGDPCGCDKTSGDPVTGVTWQSTLGNPVAVASQPPVDTVPLESLAVPSLSLPPLPTLLD